MTFIIKSLAPVVVGGGLGTGGVYAYRSVIPTTWREYLEREGFQILNTEEDNKDFKAIFVEHEELIKASSDSTLKQASSVSDHSKIKEYCVSELQKNTNGDASTKEQLIKLCTYSGISTVKAKITESKKDETTDLSWIKDENGDDKYKAVFAVYRYSTKFLEWLNEGKSESEKIKSSDEVDNKYTELKNKCKSDSIKKHSENKERKSIYNSVYWWCVALGYETVQERINKVDSSWQKEETGSKIKTKWENTESVKNAIKTDNSKDTDPEDSDYSSWCTTQLSKKLHEKDIYQKKYLQVKSVCKKQEGSS